MTKEEMTNNANGELCNYHNQKPSIYFNLKQHYTNHDKNIPKTISEVDDKVKLCSSILSLSSTMFLINHHFIKKNSNDKWLALLVRERDRRPYDKLILCIFSTVKNIHLN